MTIIESSHTGGRARAAAIFTLLAVLLASCAPVAVQPAAASAPTAVPTPIAQAVRVLGSELATVTPADGRIVVPAVGLESGKAMFYALRSGGKVIPFFVVTGADGVTRAALDACDVCYESHLGYRQEGDVMICNNCGNRFPVTRINQVSGGCNPVGVTVEVRDGQAILKQAELEAGARFF